MNSVLIAKSKSFKYSKISYGFFSRKGGISSKPFETLNCGLSSGDTKNNVKINIQLALKLLGLNNRLLITGKQVHGNKVLIINRNFNFKRNYSVDGFVTKEKKFAIGILTADCAPIFFYDPINDVIAAAHAGWRGCLKNICSSTISSMSILGCKKNNIKAIIGPCISYKNYEVSNSLVNQFINKDKTYTKFFKKRIGNKYNFDLSATLQFQLRKLGIRNVALRKEDTYSDKVKYFSHRRSIHLGGNKTGRMINVIGFQHH